LNAGATLESSLVWSPKSFVPRSAEMGLSVDVFGQAVNFFEVLLIFVKCRPSKFRNIDRKQMFVDVLRNFSAKQV